MKPRDIDGRRGLVVRGHTSDEPHELRVEFGFSKGLTPEDAPGLLDALEAALASELALTPEIQIDHTNWRGEAAHTVIIPVRLAIVTRQASGSASTWDLVIRILNVTADVMTIAAGSFTAAKLVRRLFQRAQETLPERKFEVMSEEAAALLVLAYLATSKPEVAADVAADGGWSIFASDHGGHFLASVWDFVSNDRLVFMVESDGKIHEWEEVRRRNT